VCAPRTDVGANTRLIFVSVVVVVAVAIRAFRRQVRVDPPHARSLGKRFHVRSLVSGGSSAPPESS
jgi:hypothetical protein